MNSFRDFQSAQCGQPSALNTMSASINTTNQSILADAQIYKQGPLINNNNNINNNITHNIPTSNNLMDEFNKTKTINNKTPPQPLITNNNNNNQQNLVVVPHNNNNNNYNNQLPMHQQLMQQNLMGHPLQYQLSNNNNNNNFMQFQQQPMLQQMYQNIYANQQQLFHHKSQIQQQQQNQQNQQNQNTDKIVTNGNENLKDEKEVDSELHNLRPTKQDINSINNLFDSTKNDTKMQNSQFFKFLNELKNKPPIDEDIQINNNNNNNTNINNMEEKKDDYLSKEWMEQFKNWNINNNMNHNIDDQEMMNHNAFNTIEKKDPEYIINEKNNPYLNQNNNNNNNNNNDNKMDYFSEGIRLMNKGNLNEAILAFEACVKNEPNRSEAWRYLGICQADNENDNNAIAAYLQCNKLDPYDLDALLQLGVSYTNETDSFRACTYLNNWILNHPDYNHLNSNNNNATKNNNIQQQPDHGTIVNIFQAALKINSNDSDLHIVLGVLYNITSEFNKAEYHFKKSIQQRPSDASLWNKLGATQANGGKSMDAINAYSRALELKPNYVRCLSNLGISFANQDKHREACQSYLHSLSLNNSADSVWDHLQMSLIHLGRSDLVQLCSKKNVELFRKHFDF